MPTGLGLPADRYGAGNLGAVTGIRITIGLIIAAIVAVALIPMLVLLDLAGGGDGWGLCEGGIATCRTSYFDGPELLAMLLIALFLLLMLLRVKEESPE